MLAKSIIAFIIAVTPLAGLEAQAAAGRTTVPVRRVVLFSSGVGYYEHSGTVHGDGVAELRFKAEQINDVLKSLVLQDRDGGHVSAVTYPSQAPLSRTLKSFQLDITSNPSLADLLNQLRGARVTVQAPGERISGTILGVETRRKAAGPGEPIAVPTLDLLTGGTIRAIELPSVTGLSLDDPQLQDELTKALAALAQARDQDTKPVTIDFEGAGDRRVRVGYVVEAPVWKTSYRLLLGEAHNQLQGWAIVENQTESDWNDVSLSLVSGRPISFIMDLYQPLYASRPTIVPKLFAGLRPQVYESGIASATDSVTFAAKRIAGGVAIPPVASPQRTFNRGATNLSAVVVTGANAEPEYDLSARAVAEGIDLGQLFEYSVGNVTLPRQKSAMLPIIVDSVGIERVSIYNPAVLPRNALTGVRLTNSTGKLLLQGPITVLDKNTYAGDARIDDVPAGQSRLLSYGVDLQLVMQATPAVGGDRIVTAKIVKGVLQVQNEQIATVTYRAENKSDRNKVIIIEHPVRGGFTLVDTPKPLEVTSTLYRFEGKAPARKVTILTVKEQIVRSNDMAITSADPAVLLTYSRTNQFPTEVRDALIKAVQMRQRLTDTERQINEHGQRLAQITQEQARIREDMKTVSPTTPYYARLLAKLNDQESSIEKLQQERDALSARRDGQRQELEDFVQNLMID